MMTVFEYCYRDAGNFKAFGHLTLNGVLSLGEISTIRERLSGDGLFIAEQINVPPLYEQLYQWSGGPTSSDHCWHEFVDIKVLDKAERPEGSHEGGDSQEFLAHLLAIDSWDEDLSPHFRFIA